MYVYLSTNDFSLRITELALNGLTIFMKFILFICRVSSWRVYRFAIVLGRWSCNNQGLETFDMDMS